MCVCVCGYMHAFGASLKYLFGFGTLPHLSADMRIAGNKNNGKRTLFSSARILSFPCACVSLSLSLPLLHVFQCCGIGQSLLHDEVYRMCSGLLYHMAVTSPQVLKPDSSSTHHRHTSQESRLLLLHGVAGKVAMHLLHQFYESE